jgi:hypothetical protein
MVYEGKMTRLKKWKTGQRGRRRVKSTIGSNPIQLLLEFSSDDISILFGISYSSVLKSGAKWTYVRNDV